MRDIHIIGGGLCGLSLGIALRLRGVPVVISEAGSYPRHRVCGEFISGVTHETLKFLGIDSIFSEAIPHHHLTWMAHSKPIFSATLPEQAWGISRYRLDDWLQKRFMELGGTLHLNTRLSSQQQEGEVFTAGRRPVQSEYIGLKMHVRIPDWEHRLEMHLASNGYIGLSTIENGWVNLCGLFKKHSNFPKTDQKEQLLFHYLEIGGNAKLAARMKHAEWRKDSFSAVAGFHLGTQAQIRGTLTLGDAQSMIPPFTGNGMSMAFQAAELAVNPLITWAENKCSWQDTQASIQQALKQRFTKRLRHANLIHRALTSPSLQPSIQSLAASGALPFSFLLNLVR